MEQRISIITLGVENIARASQFYQRLGWKAASQNENIHFFQLGGIALALYPRELLAEDVQISKQNQGQGFSGITLAYNTRDEAEVDSTLQEAEAAGATLLKKAQKVFWGGYSGYFADPDGHIWEVAYNPFSRIDDEGNFHISG